MGGFLAAALMERAVGLKLLTFVFGDCSKR